MVFINFSLSEIFYFKLSPRLRNMKIRKKFVEISIFCNAMVCKGYLNQKKIVVTNGLTPCKVKQGSKLGFQFKYYN